MPKGKVGDPVRVKDSLTHRAGQVGTIIALVRVKTTYDGDGYPNNNLRYKVQFPKDGAVLQLQGYGFDVEPTTGE